MLVSVEARVHSADVATCPVVESLVLSAFQAAAQKRGWIKFALLTQDAPREGRPHILFYRARRKPGSYKTLTGGGNVVHRIHTTASNSVVIAIRPGSVFEFTVDSVPCLGDVCVLINVVIEEVNRGHETAIANRRLCACVGKL